MKIKPFIFVISLFMPSLSMAQTGFLPSFADLVEKLSPSVVNISTTSQNNTSSADIPLLEGTENIQDNNKNIALGSGFILDTEGHILTNNHVIEHASEITVILQDNTPLSAIVIGRDSKTDLALIKIDTNKPLSPVEFGDSDKVRVGDWILAIGNPFGLGGSVTAGIVSAKSRDIASGPYDNFIQTDASINQGSSGGPMFNLAGQVIGINTAIYSTTGASMGIGFAIPANIAHFVIKELKEHGKVNRSWIGIKIQPNSETLPPEFKLTEKKGVTISDISENSPAQTAGLEAGDIILSVNNQELTTPQNFSRTISELTSGKDIAIKIWRNGQIHNYTVTTAPMPEISPKQDISTKNDTNSIKLLGLTLDTPSQEQISKYKLNNSQGLIISNIATHSDAAQKGLQKGNILLKINNKDVYNQETAHQHIMEAYQENKEQISLTIIDEQNNIHFVTVNFAEDK